MKSKTIKRTLLLGLLAGLVLVAGGYAGYKGYKSARQTRLVKQAQNYLAKPTERNERRALLCLQRALRYDPKDVEACRLMADLAERGRSPAALIWRSRVVELRPHSVNDRLTLAETAMMFHDYASATNALEGVGAAGKNTAAYHNTAGAVASAVGLWAQAEADFLEAAQLEPTNPAPQLNLAVVRLHGTNSQELVQARAALSSISETNSLLRCQALRELLVDSLRFRQTNSALALSEELVQQTNSAFSDRLLRLDVVKAGQAAAYGSALAAARQEAGTNVAKVEELAVWQMGRSGPADTLAWLRSLPMSLQTNLPVALTIADCYNRVGDWKGLQGAVERQFWGELEPTRYAFKARALRGQDLVGAATGEWELALEAARNQKASQVGLLRLAAAWHWEKEAQDLLWTIVNSYPGEKWAVQALSQILFANGQTRPLMQLYAQELRRHPAESSVKNNLAMTALLLDAKELNPDELAREVYEKSPTNSSYASTYAYSLYLQKKNAEALKVMERIKPQQLENPSIAGYYGLILQAAGQPSKAKTYLDASGKGSLLPEERRLFERARSGV